MRKWLFWILLVASGLVLFFYDYLWRFEFIYWVNKHVDAFLSFVLP